MEFLLSVLAAYYSDPRIFLSVLFVYSILTAIILPLPVEAALIPILSDTTFLGIAALTLGIGKAVGAGLIFVLGLKVESAIRVWSARQPWLGRLVGYVTRFVRVTKWFGLFILLSIPFMADTVPIYVYSIFNKQGQLISGRIFLIVNFLAGINRTFIFVTAFALGLRLPLL